VAQFELNIYGENDEILKTYATDKVRWGVFLEAAKLNEEIGAMDAAEQFGVISAFMCKIFPTLTDADLELADGDDVMNTFKQLLRKANKIAGGNSKNA
jgi:hypothetical protein